MEFVPRVLSAACPEARAEVASAAKRAAGDTNLLRLAQVKKEPLRELCFSHFAFCLDFLICTGFLNLLMCACLACLFLFCSFKIRPEALSCGFLLIVCGKSFDCKAFTCIYFLFIVLNPVKRFRVAFSL